MGGANTAWDQTQSEADAKRVLQAFQWPQRDLFNDGVCHRVFGLMTVILFTWNENLVPNIHWWRRIAWIGLSQLRQPAQARHHLKACSEAKFNDLISFQTSCLNWTLMELTNNPSKGFIWEFRSREVQNRLLSSIIHSPVRPQGGRGNVNIVNELSFLWPSHDMWPSWHEKWGILKTDKDRSVDFASVWLWYVCSLIWNRAPKTMSEIRPRNRRVQSQHKSGGLVLSQPAAPETRSLEWFVQWSPHVGDHMSAPSVMWRWC